jgi:hypothetical protein
MILVDCEKGRTGIKPGVYPILSLIRRWATFFHGRHPSQARTGEDMVEGSKTCLLHIISMFANTAREALAQDAPL